LVFSVGCSGVVDGGAFFDASLQDIARLAQTDASRLSGDGGGEEEDRHGGNDLLSGTLDDEGLYLEHFQVV
jgi:hypothetical protein